jgi:SAM-dependent methyltransferase
MKDEFINVSYWSVVKISRYNILKALKSNVSFASGRLVDIGCGTKPYESIFSPYVDVYFGVDYPQTMGNNYGLQTKADLYADCTNTGLRSCSFDTLLSTQVIEHIFDTKKFVLECNRILVPGGIGIFTIPFVWQCHAEPYDFYRFTRYSIEKLFIESGFEILKLENLEGAYATLIQARMVSLLSRKHGNILLKIICKLRNCFYVPYLNCKALLFDKVFYSDKLCLNYFLIVRKYDIEKV